MDTEGLLSPVQRNVKGQMLQPMPVLGLGTTKLIFTPVPISTGFQTIA